jgi:hypothetical protein
MAAVHTVRSLPPKAMNSTASGLLARPIKRPETPPAGSDQKQINGVAEATVSSGVFAEADADGGD